MACKLEFRGLEALLAYAMERGGGDNVSTPAQRAYTRIYSLCCRYNITLGEVKEGLGYMIEHATNARRAKIYRRVANAIVL